MSGAGPLWWEASGPPDGPVLLLVPDAHRPAAAWPAPLLAGLTGAGWRVVLVDLRDQGRSPWGPEQYSVTNLAADLGHVVRAAAGPSARPLDVVAHGFGATVALELAALHPDQLRRLVVVGGTGWFADPTLPGPEEPVVVGLIWRTRLAEAGGTPPAAAHEGLARALARELRLLASASDDPGPAAAVAETERWLAWGFNPADAHGRCWLEAPPRWDALSELACPLEVVHGGEDPLVPVEHGRRLAELAERAGSRARFVEVPRAGHALTPPLVEAIVRVVGPAAGISP